MLERLVEDIGPVFQSAGYWIVAGAVMLERSIFVGLIVPGDVVLALGGIYSSRGHLTLGWVITVAVLAAIAGESIGYSLGRLYGRGLIARIPMIRRLGPKLDTAEAYFAKHGTWTVFFGRFATAAGAFIPFVAGVAKMPFHRFIAIDIPAIVIWAGGIAAVGYAFGSNLDRVENLLSRFGLAALGLLVVAFLIRFLIRRRRPEAIVTGDGEATPPDGTASGDGDPS